ncbi:DUF7261 family protein [Haloparvum sp. AD34]
MADLMALVPGGDSGHDTDRAQLVLVTALILGVALIALVLLVNAAIYTENLATRDPDVGDEEVLAYEATVVDGVGGIVDRENANEYDTYDAVETNVSAGVETLNDHLERSRLEHGLVASMNVSNASYVEGRLIVQTNESRNFTAGDGTSDWTLAENVSAARNHVATVRNDKLISTNASNASNDGAFHVVLDGDSGNEWHAYVYENGSNISVAVKPGGVGNPADAEEVCSVDSTNATIDFTAGTIDGTKCPGLNWGESISDEYDLEYANSENASGTYEVTVRGTDDNLVNIGDIIMESSDTSPRFAPAVYSVELAVTYRSPDLEYTTTVRVARGEPDA